MSSVAISDLRGRKIRVERLVGEATSDVTVGGMVSVPAGKPDIASILRVDERAIITRVTLVRNGIVVEGTIELNILYVAALPTQPVHFFEASFPFTHFIRIPGAAPGMIPEVVITAQFESHRLVDPRTVEVNVILSFRARVFVEEITEVVVEVPEFIAPPIKVRKRAVRVERVVLEGEAEAIATGNIVIPASSPSVSDVVHVDAASRVTDVDVIRNKVIVDGVVHVRVLFVALLPQQPVFVVDGRVDFHTFVPMAGVEPSMFAFAVSKVEHVDVDIIDPRTLRVRAIVKVKVLVGIEKEIEFITRIEEVLIPNEVVNQEFLAEQVTSEREERSVFKVSVAVPAGKPDVSRVILASGRAHIGRISVEQDRVLVEGTLRLNILYVAREPAGQVISIEESVPFFTTVSAPGARAGMSGVADVDVEQVTAQPVDMRVLDVRVILRTWALVVSTERISAVVGLRRGEAIQPAPAAPGVIGPAVRSHIVKPGETLWQIAQIYNTTIDAIVRANDIRDPNILEVGEVLVIPI